MLYAILILVGQATTVDSFADSNWRHTMRDTYSSAFTRLMELEGHLADHKEDPGGLTVYGISSVHYPEYYRDGKKPTLSDARAFYFRAFWLPLQCDKIVCSEVAFELFESAVLCGQSNGAMFLQRAFNLVGCRETGITLTIDGSVGNMTVATVNAFCSLEINRRALVTAQNYYQAEYLVGRRNSAFIKGWMANRIGGVVWTDKV